MILAAASRINVPSTPLEKYSALPCPKAWSSSAGRAAIVNIANAISAPTRLTRDSSASESRPTEPVSKYAVAFSAMVRMAAAIESQAKRVRDERFLHSPLFSAPAFKLLLPYRSVGWSRTLRLGARLTLSCEYSSLRFWDSRDRGRSSRSLLRALHQTRNWARPWGGAPDHSSRAMPSLAPFDNWPDRVLYCHSE